MNIGNLSITDEAHFDNDYTEESSVALMSEPSPVDMESQAALFLLKANKINEVSQSILTEQSCFSIIIQK